MIGPAASAIRRVNSSFSSTRPEPLAHSASRRGCPRYRDAGSRSRQDRSRSRAPASRAGRTRRARARIPRLRRRSRSPAIRRAAAARARTRCRALRARTAPASPGRKMSMRLQCQRGRRKRPRLDRTGDAHLQAGQPAGPVLELAAILVPIDEKRTDQRRHQRQDDRNRNTEQRRLHAVSKAGLLLVRHGWRGAAPDPPQPQKSGRMNSARFQPLGHVNRSTPTELSASPAPSPGTLWSCD